MRLLVLSLVTAVIVSFSVPPASAVKITPSLDDLSNDPSITPVLLTEFCNYGFEWSLTRNGVPTDEYWNATSGFIWEDYVEMVEYYEDQTNPYNATFQFAFDGIGSVGYSNSNNFYFTLNTNIFGASGNTDETLYDLYNNFTLESASQTTNLSGILSNRGTVTYNYLASLTGAPEEFKLNLTVTYTFYKNSLTFKAEVQEIGPYSIIEWFVDGGTVVAGDTTTEWVTLQNGNAYGITGTTFSYYKPVIFLENIRSENIYNDFDSGDLSTVLDNSNYRFVDLISGFPANFFQARSLNGNEISFSLTMLPYDQSATNIAQKLESARQWQRDCEALETPAGGGGTGGGVGSSTVLNNLKSNNKTIDDWNDTDIYLQLTEDILQKFPNSQLQVANSNDLAITKFIPTDLAFRRFVTDLTGKQPRTEKATYEKLLSIDTKVMEQILMYHLFVGDSLDIAQLYNSTSKELASLQGKIISLKINKDGAIVLRDANKRLKNPKVIASLSDINKGNRQLAHGIDRVLVPASKKKIIG